MAEAVLTSNFRRMKQVKPSYTSTFRPIIHNLPRDCPALFSLTSLEKKTFFLRLLTHSLHCSHFIIPFYPALLTLFYTHIYNIIKVQYNNTKKYN